MFQEYKQFFALIYIIPSLVLYFIVLYKLFFSTVRKQKLSSVFYKLFGFSAIIYIIHALIYYLLIRLPTIPFLYPLLINLPKENFCYPYLLFLLYYSGHAVHFCNFAISFNRFTVFALKLGHNDFWKKYLRLILWICALGPVICVWNLLFTKVENLQVIPNRAFFPIQTTSWPTWMDKARNLTIQICFSATVSLLMNSYFIYCLINRRIYGVENAHKISSQDAKLFVYTFLVFLTEFFSAFTQALLAIDANTFAGIILDNQYLIADLNALAPIWFILITDKILRNEIFKVFKINEKFFATQVRDIHILPNIT